MIDADGVLVDGTGVGHEVHLGEGGTPVLSLRALAERLKIRRLSAKMESLNPTGSYKDRIAARSISLALERGNKGWIATSSGNAGVAFAAYGARAGLPGFLCVVSTAPTEKLAALAPYGVAVVLVEGIGDGADSSSAATLMNTVQLAAERHNLYPGITANAFNPDGMRGVEGISSELVQQAPDMTHAYVPAGGGGLLTSIARGLRGANATARVICCQPSGCSPIVRYLHGELAEPAVADCQTGISALQLTAPPDGPAAADAVRRSGGWGVAVTDEEIMAAQQLLAETEGIFVEPASAAALAALLQDVEHGRLAAEDHPVLVLTGAGWKDLRHYVLDEGSRQAVGVVLVASAIDDWVDQLPARA